MNDETKVWIRKRTTGKGKAVYDLRWIDPATGKWKSRKAGTDSKRAEGERVQLEKDLARGTHHDLRRVTWAEFADEHVGKIAGAANATEAKRTLAEFGKAFGVPPKRVTFGMVESYVEDLKAKGNAVATINKKLRYLRSAFNRAIRRGYVVKHPMDGWQWTGEDKKAPRIVSEDEEKVLLAAAKARYGAQMKAFITTALATGGRRGELLAITWDRVDLDEGRVHFAETKGKRDRFVPIDPETVAMLRRLQARTLREGGPFIGLADNVGRMWRRVKANALALAKGKKQKKAVAKVGELTIHDLRKTFVTRLIRAGVALPTVQRLAGHANISTTVGHYNFVSDGDMRDAIERLRKAQTAG